MKDEIALRKRSQISKANRTMFIWIAIASALIGAALVVSVFMVQKAVYGEKVLAEKKTTASVIEHNLDTIPKLQDEIRVLDTDTALMSIKANESDQAIQVILDALPSDANSLALGSSLQNRLLVGIGSAKIDSLQVDPVVGVESLTGEEAVEDAGATSSDGTTEGSGYVITFRFTLIGNATDLRKALENVEKSIRTIVMTSVRVEGPQDSQVMTVDAKAFYQPETKLELTQKTVKK